MQTHATYRLYANNMTNSPIHAVYRRVIVSHVYSLIKLLAIFFQFELKLCVCVEYLDDKETKHVCHQLPA